MLGLRGIVIGLANAYMTIIIIYVVMSWIPSAREGNGMVGQVYDALGKLCDPFLNLFKRLIPPIGGVLDITPIIALLVLQFAVNLIVRFL